MERYTDPDRPLKYSYKSINHSLINAFYKRYWLPYAFKLVPERTSANLISIIGSLGAWLAFLLLSGLLVGPMRMEGRSFPWLFGLAALLHILLSHDGQSRRHAGPQDGIDRTAGGIHRSLVRFLQYLPPSLGPRARLPGHPAGLRRRLHPPLLPGRLAQRAVGPQFRRLEIRPDLERGGPAFQLPLLSRDLGLRLRFLGRSRPLRDSESAVRLLPGADRLPRLHSHDLQALGQARPSRPHAVQRHPDLRLDCPRPLEVRPLRPPRRLPPHGLHGGQVRGRRAARPTRRARVSRLLRST